MKQEFYNLLILTLHSREMVLICISAKVRKLLWHNFILAWSRLDPEKRKTDDYPTKSRKVGP